MSLWCGRVRARLGRCLPRPTSSVRSVPPSEDAVRNSASRRNSCHSPRNCISGGSPTSRTEFATPAMAACGASPKASAWRPRNSFSVRKPSSATGRADRQQRVVKPRRPRITRMPRGCLRSRTVCDDNHSGTVRASPESRSTLGHIAVAGAGARSLERLMRDPLCQACVRRSAGCFYCV